MATVTVTVEIESYDDSDPDADRVIAGAIRNALVHVAEFATEFFPGNVAISSDAS